MSVAIGIFVAAAMIVTLCVSLLTNVKVWGIIRESHASIRRLEPQKRRRVIGQLAVMYLVTGAWVAVLLAAPFGMRATIIYFVIVPFFTVIPIVVIAAAIRGFRDDRRRRRQPPPA